MAKSVLSVTTPDRWKKEEYGILYCDTDDKITRVVSALNRAADRGEPSGLDTEFYGVDLRQHSTVASSRLHLISAAVTRFPAEVHPRGYPIADAAVFPASAIDHRGLRAWMESTALKAVHNLPVDAHTLGNAKVWLNGGINTLALARWTWPGRARNYAGSAPEGFTLDALGQDLLGFGKSESFDELFSEDVTEYTVKSRKVRVCSCGEPVLGPGHPRQSKTEHIKSFVVAEQRTEKRVRRPIPLADVVPGHPLWTRALRYSAQDAVIALAVYFLALRENNRRKVDVPWL